MSFNVGDRVLVEDEATYRGVITELTTVDPIGNVIKVRVQYDVPRIRKYWSPAWSPGKLPVDTWRDYREPIILSEVFFVSSLTKDYEWYRQEKIDQIL